MLCRKLKHILARFRDDRRGSITVEMVLCIPLLFWVAAASYEFFEIHRYKSAREKATYTVADMLSREMAPVNDTYIDNAKTLFDLISNDDGTNQLRISVVRYDADSDTYSISWSEVRGTGRMSALVDADVTTAHSTLPIMNDGEELILVESRSSYAPILSVGFDDTVPIGTRVFTAIRFAPQVVWASG